MVTLSQFSWFAQRCIIPGFVIEISVTNHCVYFLLFACLFVCFSPSLSERDRQECQWRTLGNDWSVTLSWLPSFIPSIPTMLFSDCHFGLASQYSKPLLMSNWRDERRISSPTVSPNAATQALRHSLNSPAWSLSSTWHFRIKRYG